MISCKNNEKNVFRICTRNSSKPICPPFLVCFQWSYYVIFNNRNFFINKFSYFTHSSFPLILINFYLNYNFILIYGRYLTLKLIFIQIFNYFCQLCFRLILLKLRTTFVFYFINFSLHLYWISLFFSHFVTSHQTVMKLRIFYLLFLIATFLLLILLNFIKFPN